MDKVTYTKAFITKMQVDNILPTNTSELTNPEFQLNIKVISKMDVTKDGIIKLEIAKDGLYSIPEKENNTYIAGGYVLRKLYKCLGIKNNWPKTDVDIYTLNYDKMYRYSFEDELDFIHTYDKDVETLLLRFDLPVCRAGMDTLGNIYVSIQCLAAIFNQEQHLPSYFNNFDEYIYTLSKYIDLTSKGLEIARNAWNKYRVRIEKYTKRGIIIKYYDTDKICLCTQYVIDYLSDNRLRFDNAECIKSKKENKQKKSSNIKLTRKEYIKTIKLIQEKYYNNEITKDEYFSQISSIKQKYTNQNLEFYTGNTTKSIDNKETNKDNKKEEFYVGNTTKSIDDKETNKDDNKDDKKEEFYVGNTTKSIDDKDTKSIDNKETNKSKNTKDVDNWVSFDIETYSDQIKKYNKDKIDISVQDGIISITANNISINIKHK